MRTHSEGFLVCTPIETLVCLHRIKSASKAVLSKFKAILVQHFIAPPRSIKNGVLHWLQPIRSSSTPSVKKMNPLYQNVEVRLRNIVNDRKCLRSLRAQELYQF